MRAWVTLACGAEVVGLDYRENRLVRIVGDSPFDRARYWPDGYCCMVVFTGEEHLFVQDWPTARIGQDVDSITCERLSSSFLKLRRKRSQSTNSRR